MKDYLLFVDTETSGLPRDWSRPYSDAENWPYIVQLAWIIYTRDGREVKRENHYIQAKDYKISEISREIHGISDQFLLEHGEERKTVMQQIYNDLLAYQPLVVGHFMQLDYHMLGLGFYRAGLDNPLHSLPTFCTMVMTGEFMLPRGQKYLRLPELYLRLFGTPMQQEHNALVDAGATARCFFELWRRGDLDEHKIAAARQIKALPRNKKKNPVLYVGLMILMLLLIFLLFHWLL